MGNAKAICGAVTSSGKLCRLKAGQGTKHPGTGPCSKHFGTSHLALRAAAAPELEMLTGYALKVDPHEAMLMCIRIAAAEVNFYSYQIAELTADEVVEVPTKKVLGGKDKDTMYEVSGFPQLNFWIRARKDAVRDLMQYSKNAIEIGLQERMVDEAERHGERMAQFIEGVFSDLEFTKEQLEAARPFIQKRLLQLEAAA